MQWCTCVQVLQQLQLRRAILPTCQPVNPVNLAVGTTPHLSNLRSRSSRRRCASSSATCASKRFFSALALSRLDVICTYACWMRSYSTYRHVIHTNTPYIPPARHQQPARLSSQLRAGHQRNGQTVVWAGRRATRLLLLDQHRLLLHLCQQLLQHDVVLLDLGALRAQRLAHLHVLAVHLDGRQAQQRRGRGWLHLRRGACWGGHGSMRSLQRPRSRPTRAKSSSFPPHAVTAEDGAPAGEANGKTGHRETTHAGNTVHASAASRQPPPPTQGNDARRKHRAHKHRRQCLPMSFLAGRRHPSVCLSVCLHAIPAGSTHPASRSGRQATRGCRRRPPRACARAAAAPRRPAAAQSRAPRLPRPAPRRALPPPPRHARNEKQLSETFSMFFSFSHLLNVDLWRFGQVTSR
jgi:hypothetical protein